MSMDEKTDDGGNPISNSLELVVVTIIDSPSSNDAATTPPPQLIDLRHNETNAAAADSNCTNSNHNHAAERVKSSTSFICRICHCNDQPERFVCFFSSFVGRARSLSLSFSLG